MTPANRQRVQAYLRQALACPTLSLETVSRGPMELRVAGQTLGTVDQVDDEGERSWAVTIVVLEDDLTGS
jgi:hypothetical protein